MTQVHVDDHITDVVVARCRIYALLGVSVRIEYDYDDDADEEWVQYPSDTCNSWPDRSNSSTELTHVHRETHSCQTHAHTHILFQSYTYFSAHKCPCVLTQWPDMESSNPVTQKCVSSTIYKNSGCSKRIFVVIFGAVLMPQPLLASVAATTASVIVLLPYAPFQK